MDRLERDPVYTQVMESRRFQQRRALEEDIRKLKKTYRSSRISTTVYIIACFVILAVSVILVGRTAGLQLTTILLVWGLILALHTFSLGSQIARKKSELYHLRREETKKRWKKRRLEERDSVRAKKSREVVLPKMLAAEKADEARELHLRKKYDLRGALRLMNPTAFERATAKAFEMHGYSVDHTGGTGDIGCDLLLEKNGKSWVVEVKHFTDGKVGRPVLQKLQGAMLHFRTDGLKCVTSSYFTASAKSYGTEHGIDLIDLDEFLELAKDVDWHLYADIERKPASTETSRKVETEELEAYCDGCGRRTRHLVRQYEFSSRWGCLLCGRIYISKDGSEAKT